jgi:hypothetical protein
MDRASAKSLFWLSFQRDGRWVGVVIIEAGELLEAQMLAVIDGTDEGAQFANGYQLSAAQAALISARSVGRMLPPDEASRLLAWIESEAARTIMRTN